MRNYTQFNVEDVFSEPGLLYVALSKNGRKHPHSTTGNIEKLIEVPVEQIRLHLLKLMNGLEDDLSNGRTPQDAYIANFDALLAIVEYIERSTSYKFPFKTRTSQAF